MPRPLPALRLTGARILRDGALQARSIAIADGTITRGPLPEVDLTGYLVLPGIVDLHARAVERHLSHRPGAPGGLRSALHATDREAAANGVTTAWLAQGWSWEGGRRDPDVACRMLGALDTYRAEALTDLRALIRCETHTVDTCDRLLQAVAAHKVDQVVFHNGLDAALVTASTRPEVFAEAARHAGRSVAAHMERLRAARRQAREVPRHLCRLAERFDTLGVVYGSQGDPDGETRETFSMIGAKVCAFPTARAAAALARAVGDPVVMGAAEVLRGRARAGTVSTVELIRAGLCDALVSDDSVPALAQAAFRLVDDGVLDLPRAWAMISDRPAAMLRLPDRGRLDPGCRADLVVVNARTRAIEATIAAGRITHLAGEAAQRFRRARDVAAIAAE